MNQKITTKLKSLPTDSGVYIMLDSDNNILYVGKAKNLKNRVKQYFTASGDKSDKVLAMLSHVQDFRYIITASEQDALTLENTLIKKHTPPYNILLKDDKQYPYVKIDVTRDYPKIEFTRKLVRDKARYFGPITSGGIKSMATLLGKLFPTITCNHNFDNLKKDFRPCLDRDIGRCCAPCIGAVTKQQYRQIIDDAIEFLSGNTALTRKRLVDQMQICADKEQYEQALALRQNIETLDCIKGSTVTALKRVVDFDGFSIASNGHNSVVCHIMVRGGKVVYSDNFVATDGGIDEQQTLTSFLLEYCKTSNISNDITTNIELADNQVLMQLVSIDVGHSVTIGCAKRGDKKKICDMAYVNAQEYLIKSQSDIERRYNSTVGAVSQLRQLLNLKALPKRIECYDISNISGVDKVASQVVFVNGGKAADQYRRYRIKTVDGANDFASMKEALVRRLCRLSDNKFGDRPDLIVVDGGLGQLDYARQALQESGENIEIVSLAKREELVYTLASNVPIELPRNSYALNLLINLRDEAHRFAITYFRQLHGKNAWKSILSEIEGVGDKRQKALQRHFKNIDNITNATIEQLLQVDGINNTVATNIYNYFHATK